MVNALLITSVLVVLVTLTDGDIVDCNSSENNLGQQCEQGSICAWNRCTCRPGKVDCSLICTNNMKQWCNGLSEGDSCIASEPQWECVKCGKHLMCMNNPLGPVCLVNGNRYYAGESVDVPSTCYCVDNGDIQCVG